MIDRAAYFSAKLAYETDASDVHAARTAGEPLVIVDVRSTEAWTQGRVVDAVHMPYREIATRAPAEIPRDARWSCTAGALDATPATKAPRSSRSSATTYAS